MRKACLGLMPFFFFLSFFFLTGGAAAPAAEGGDAALAPRLESLAQEALAGLSPDDLANVPLWRQAAALLDAARRCDPNEVRYLWQLADAARHAGDGDQELNALKAIRLLTPEDRAMQIRTVELYLQRMETLDKRIAYLRDVVERESVALEARSALALACANLLGEQGKRDERAVMIDRSLTLNPLNWQALEAKWNDRCRELPAPQRVELLLQMLRSNPSKPGVMSSVARELANAGLVKQSVAWYTKAVELRLRRFDAAGEAVSDADLAELSATAVDFAGELIIAGEPQRAASLLDFTISTVPSDKLPRTILSLRYLCALKADERMAAAWRAQARNSLVSELAAASAMLQQPAAQTTTRPTSGASTTQPAPEKSARFKPTTQPAAGLRPEPLPDLTGDVTAYKAAQDASIKASYLQALDELAWFVAYFEENPKETEALLAVRQRLSPPVKEAAESFRIFQTRLEGWVYLLKKQWPEARTKLLAVSSEDPMAALGLVHVYLGENDNEKAKAEAQKLLAQYPGTVLGALICSDMSRLKLDAQVTAGAQAAAIEAALKQFPEEWLKVVDNLGEFLQISGQPIRPVLLGEPMLYRVTLRNASKGYGLTIGADGVIPSVLRFDVLTSVAYEARQQPFPGICVDRITERLVLPAGESLTRTVRLDQGALAEFLQKNPIPDVSVRVFLFGVPLDRGFIRSSNPRTRQPQIERDIETGSPRERLRNLDVRVAIGANEESERIAKFITEKKLSAAADPAVRAWIMYVLAMHSLSDREATVERMVADPAWQVRLLGLVAAGKLRLEPEKQKQLLSGRAADADATVKEYAAGRRLAMEQATTRPTTRSSAPN